MTTLAARDKATDTLYVRREIKMHAPDFSMMPSARETKPQVFART